MVSQVGSVERTAIEPDVSAIASRHSELSLGDIYYVDANNGNDSFNGQHPAFAFKTLAVALAAMSFNDTLFVARGGYTGDFTTNLNAVAAFSQIRGLNASDRFFGAFLASSTSTEPILSIRARGMRVTGLEFDGAALDASIELARTSGAAQRSDGAEIDHCLFTGGKFGIDQDSSDNNGGTKYIHVHHCMFDLMSVAAGAGISATNTSNSLAGRWQVDHCEFSECVANIDMSATVGNHGFNSSIIGPDNVFQAKGQARDADPLIDIVGGAGNQVVNNDWGVAKSVSVAATSLIEIGDNDRASGNRFTDGQQTGDFAST